MSEKPFAKHKDLGTYYANRFGVYTDNFTDTLKEGDIWQRALLCAMVSDGELTIIKLAGIELELSGLRHDIRKALAAREEKPRITHPIADAMLACLKPPTDSTPLSELDMPTRIRNRLRCCAYKMRTIGDLLQVPAAELLCLPGIKQNSLSHIREALAKRRQLLKGDTLDDLGPNSRAYFKEKKT